MRVGAVGKVIVVVDPGVGVGPGSVIRLAGRDVPVVRIDVLIGGELVDAGRRNGSGFKTMWEGGRCLHVIPRSEDLRMSGEVQKYAGLWCLDDQDGNWPEAALHHIQWRGSKKGKSPAR